MKEWKSKYNPFNSDKLFAHLDRWKEIPRSAPALVTVDPTNLCNLACTWCNSQELQSQNKEEISPFMLRHIAKMLPNWNDSKYGSVNAVCIAGGGEPTLHDYTGKFIRQLTTNGTKAGIVTNGTGIKRHLDDLINCTWVGVSVDAGTPETYKKLKGKDLFPKVMENIELLTSQKGFDTYTESIVDTELSLPGQGHGVSYKYLLHPENVGEVLEASRLAKETGCRNMHIRPVGNPWDRSLDTTFSYGDIETFKEQLEEARQYEDDTFRIFGVTHKFDGNFNKKNDFKECMAVYMTADFQPPRSGRQDRVDLGLCCDRRGDSRLTMYDMTIKDIRNFWGSQKHKEMQENIKTSECPRCTYQPHNRIYEKCLKEDNLTYEFI